VSKNRVDIPSGLGDIEELDENILHIFTPLGVDFLSKIPFLVRAYTVE